MVKEEYGEEDDLDDFLLVMEWAKVYGGTMRRI
jgi:hypothetical protein